MTSGYTIPPNDFSIIFIIIQLEMNLIGDLHWYWSTAVVVDDVAMYLPPLCERY